MYEYVWVCMSTIVTYSKRVSHANTFLDKTFIVNITIPGNCLRNHGWVTNNKVGAGDVVGSTDDISMIYRVCMYCTLEIWYVM